MGVSENALLTGIPVFDGKNARPVLNGQLFCIPVLVGAWSIQPYFIVFSLYFMQLQRLVRKTKTFSFSSFNLTFYLKCVN